MTGANVHLLGVTERVAGLRPVAAYTLSLGKFFEKVEISEDPSGEQEITNSIHCIGVKKLKRRATYLLLSVFEEEGGLV